MKRASLFFGTGFLTFSVYIIPLLIHADCVTPPSGIVAWWQAKNNALDTVGLNDGISINGADFVSGMAGQAFSFDGINQYVKVPQTIALNSFSNQLTIEFWMKADPGNSMNTFQGLVTSDYYGIEIANGLGGAVGINWFINTPDGEFSPSSSNGGGIPVSSGQWHHIAGTYDGSKMQIYIDGVPTGNAQTASGSILPMLANSFVAIGSDDGRTYCGCTGRYFWGLIDEPSVYARALSAEEIAGIYSAGSAGKCEVSTIVQQPSNLTTVSGSNVVLSVGVGGAGPFRYQWRLNGTNISGATNSTLSLTNLHPNQSGKYDVVVTTPTGTLISSSATVTVIAQNILVYIYAGSEKVVMSGSEFSYNFSGQMFFLPANTNGVFIGWGVLNGKKQFWISPFEDYLLMSIPGSANHTYTVLGKAGDNIDANGQPSIWSYYHRGQNTLLTISSKQKFSFPNTFSCNDNHVYPVSQNGGMILREAASTYVFSSLITQGANNSGLTIYDLINTLTKTLTAQGYKKQ